MSHRGTYSVTDYGSMVRDSPRVCAYVQALREAITPGCTVLDIGAGFGFFAILACKFGAGHVFAVEPANAITIGPDLARANGCTDQIEFVQGFSTDLGEESRSDVIIADLRGALPLYMHHIPVIADARARLLRPGGTLITQRDRLRCAVMSDTDLASKIFGPWQSNTLGLDFSAGSRISVNTPRHTTVKPESLLSGPEDLAQIDYRVVTDPNLEGRAMLTATRSGPAHGVLVWFDAELAGGHGFSNEPGAPPLVYQQRAYPFEHPVDIEAGDRVEISISFRLVGEDYISLWQTRIFRDGKPDVHFTQSTAWADFVTTEDLRRRSGAHVPSASARAELDRHCLSRFDGATSIDTIASDVMERAPDRFTDLAGARAYVADLAERYREG